MIKKYTIFLTILFLIGCTPVIEVSPDKLPDAYLNQPYIENIEITGGTVVDLNFYSKVSNEEFKVIPNNTNEDSINYNNLTIKGTPTSLEPIHVDVAGDTYGTNFPGGSFEKEYIIEVKASK